MESFRNPDFVERYEDVIFDLDTPIVTAVANGASQKKEGYKFFADNSGEVAPFDWYNARIIVDFNVQLLADGADIAVDDHNGIVNGSHSLINKLRVEANGKTIYDCRNCNQAVNIKNLLDYTRQFAKDMGTNQLFFLDTNRSAEERPAQAAFNKGFAQRKALLGTSSNVNVAIPLNRYSFFEGLDNELLPNMKIWIIFDLESDGNLIWQAGVDCRVVVTRMRLFVPRIVFTAEGNKMYMERYMKPHKWNYLREQISVNDSSRQHTGTFRITSAIDRPRDVFVWIQNDARQASQTENPFLFDTFNVANNRTLVSCQLEVGNGNKYPENEYTPSAEISRVFRDVHKYSYTENEYQGGGTLLNRGNFSNIFPFIYFDLRNQKLDIKDGATKLIFSYKLSGETNANYTVYALVLYEQEIELYNTTGKLMIR